MACVSVFAPSDTCTITSYTLLAPESVGASKFGALAKVRTPVELLMVNFAESAPPLIEYTSVDGLATTSGSGSVAVTVVTAVVFSATEIDAVAPPPLLVIVGAVVSALNLAMKPSWPPFAELS